MMDPHPLPLIPVIPHTLEINHFTLDANIPFENDAFHSSDSFSPPKLLLINRHDPKVRDRLPELNSLLSTQERQSLQRYRRSEDRELYLLGKGALKLLIAHLLGRNPACINFGRGTEGKPYVIPHTDDKEAPIHFNLSHSGAFVLLGFHVSMQVGVDIERSSVGMDWIPIAMRFLDKVTFEYLLSLPADQQLKGFLREWCRLEASLKAKGVGFSGLVRNAGIDQAPCQSRLWDVELPDGYEGAAAVLA